MVKASDDYPRSEREFRAWFQTEEDCLDYLDWLRWGDELVCSRPGCGTKVPARKVTARVWRCPVCTTSVSRTAGTIFEGTRVPLTLWFAAAWEMTMDKGGISATALKRRLDLKSHQTAWTMLHKYRSAMALSGRDKLAGTVEVDETAIGGKKSGKRGRGAAGKTEVAIAIELKDPKGFGRVRLRVIPDASSKTLAAFLEEVVEPGSTIVTDAWGSYPLATKGKYNHEPKNQTTSTQKPHELLPGVHRVASLLKRWILGTFQGSVSAAHLPAYLDEFTFRFNRRHSRDRGLLFFRLMSLSASAPPVTYGELVRANHPGNKTPKPTDGAHLVPRGLKAPQPTRPWRNVAAKSL